MPRVDGPAAPRYAPRMPAPVCHAVVFDMDGLMLDTEPIYKSAWQSAVIDFGFRIDDDAYFELLGRSLRDAEGILRRRFGSDFPFGEFRTRWLEHWRTAVLRDGVPRKPGLDPLMAELKRRGVPSAVATSTQREDALFTLERAGLGGAFAHVVTGDEVEHGKPEPDIFLAAARSLGVAAEECVALEDSDAGIVAAAAAGMTALMVPDMKGPSAEAERRAYRVVSSLHDAHGLIAEMLP